jgi:ankyrin repeat protein
MLDSRPTESEILSHLQANEATMGIAEQQRALFLACQDGHEKVARWLIDRKKIDINGRDGSGQTCLHYALKKYGNMPLVEMLVANGADVNAADRNGETPLLKAMSSSREAALCFIQHGGDVTTKWVQGKTLLHLASSSGSMAVVKALLDKGAEIDARDSAGATPLHDAVSSQAAEVVTYLISKGADVRSQVKAGYRTALFSADPAHPNITHFEFPGGTATMHLAALGGDKAIATLLAAKGADIDPTDAMGNQPIHYAAMNLQTGMLEFLLRAGADPNARNRMDGTPLHYVCSFGDDSDQALRLQVAAIKLLSTQGADINARASTGERPIDLIGSDRARDHLRAQLGI